MPYHKQPPDNVRERAQATTRFDTTHVRSYPGFDKRCATINVYQNHAILLCGFEKKQSNANFLILTYL